MLRRQKNKKLEQRREGHEIRTIVWKLAAGDSEHTLLLYRRSALLMKRVATQSTNAFRFAVLGVMFSYRAPGCICSKSTTTADTGATGGSRFRALRSHTSGATGIISTFFLPLFPLF